MRQVSTTLVCILLCTSAFATPVICNTLLINTAESVTTVISAASDVQQAVLKKKKPSLKQKILMKWLKIKSEEEQKKKLVKTLGLLSFIGSLLGIGLFVTGVFSEFFALVFVGLSFSLIAFILGIVALSKRSKLKDKTGTRRWPALLGIILGIGFIIAIGITTVIMLS